MLTAVDLAQRLSAAGDSEAAWIALNGVLLTGSISLGDARRAARIALHSEDPVAAADSLRPLWRNSDDVPLLRMASALETSAGNLFEAMEAYRAWSAQDPSDPFPEAERLRLSLFDPAVTNAAYASETFKWAERHFSASRADFPVRANQEGLRIGYVSQSFTRLPRASLMQPVLEHHDTERFDIFCYSSFPQECRSGDWNVTWRDVSTDGPALLRDRIVNDRIDIAVNVDGLMDIRAIEAFALGCAPVQTAFPNYAATTGLKHIQSRPASTMLQPLPQTQRNYAEQLYPIAAPPLTYTPPRFSPPVSSSPRVRNGYLTFGSFNSALKLTEQTLALFSRILAMLPDARLTMHCPGLSGSLLQRMRRQLCPLQPMEDRVRFVGSLSHYDHLDLHNHVDVLLDSSPFCGTTTTFDALWMGKPVITLDGTDQRSGFTAYVLRELGLSDYVAASPEAYVAMAIAAGKLAEPAELHHRFIRSAFMDAKGWIAEIENWYTTLWQQALKSE